MKNMAVVAFIVMIVSGCASSGKHPQDPWEEWNRDVYDFNKSVDKYVAKPLTEGYQAITPDPLEKGISNMFGNIEDIPTMLNNLFQGKFLNSLSDFGRVVVNTTVGVGGLFDPASDLGLEKHDEDFGQTLGSWGVGSGAYVMLPFLGPSTLRDTAAMPADSVLDPINQIDDISTRNRMKVLSLLDTRAQLIKFEEQLESATDEYAFVRDIYLQNRRYKVLDGDIPFEEDCEEFGDEEDCEF